jgi:hypothetical protein
MEGQSSKIGIDAIHCAYTFKTDLYPQLIAYIKELYEIFSSVPKQKGEGCTTSWTIGRPTVKIHIRKSKLSVIWEKNWSECILYI